jgi:hypothetical protein
MRCFLFGLLLLASMARTQAAEEKPSPPTTKTLYSDKSWTHIGNGSFSPDSDSASDLTVQSTGESLRVTVPLDENALHEIQNERWKSLVIRGEVIGNDTGFVGCTATTVNLNGKSIGQIKKSGNFRILFEKSQLPKASDKPLVIEVVSGNAAGDVDDQELGQFVLELSEAEIPKPQTNEAKQE